MFLCPSCVRACFVSFVSKNQTRRTRRFSPSAQTTPQLRLLRAFCSSIAARAGSRASAGHALQIIGVGAADEDFRHAGLDRHGGLHRTLSFPAFPQVVIGQAARRSLAFREKVPSSGEFLLCSREFLSLFLNSISLLPLPSKWRSFARRRYTACVGRALAPVWRRSPNARRRTTPFKWRDRRTRARLSPCRRLLRPPRPIT